MIEIWYPIDGLPGLWITQSLRVRNEKNKVESPRFFYSTKFVEHLDPLPTLSHTDNVCLLTSPTYTINNKLEVFNQFGKRTGVFVNYKRKRWDIHLLAEKARIRKVVFKNELTILQYEFPQFLFKKALNLPPFERAELLCLNFPDLIQAWNDNPDDLPTISRASGKMCKWLCKLDNTAYSLTPMAITYQGRQCPECTPKSEHYREVCKDNIAKSAIDERWVVDELRNHPSVLKADAVGQEGNPKDDVTFVLRVEDFDRSLQVKRLTKAKKVDQYSFDMGTYPANMLIIALSEDRTRFFAAFSGTLPQGKNLTLTYTPRAKTYDEAKYYDRVKFWDYVATLLPSSIRTDEIPNRYTPEARKELEMKARLMQTCTERGLKYLPSLNNGSIVDASIERFLFQLKATSVKDSHKYTTALCHRKNGTSGCAYTEEDLFDFIAIEIVQFPGQFCIIPRAILLQAGYLGGTETKGRTWLGLYPPGSDKTDIFTPYWNAFNLLQ